MHVVWVIARALEAVNHCAMSGDRPKASPPAAVTPPGGDDSVADDHIGPG